MGNITEAERGIILHGCNLRGKMGKGLAKDIRDKYPKNYEGYLKLLPYSHLGSVTFCKINDNLIIANGMIQHNYGSDGYQYCDYQAIRNVFRVASKRALKLGLPLHYSKIGAGYAGGDWEVIKKIIEEEKIHGVEYIYWGGDC